ncbi:MAG: sugar kinase [Planctomycetota bacterium]
MIRVVTFGEIMLRVSTPGAARFRQAIPGRLETVFGGAEASVAISIANFGGRAAYVTALPDHEIGDACVRELLAHRVSTDNILRIKDARLGLYFYEAGINQRPGRVIYDRADSAFASASSDSWDWATILKDADWLVLSGITPAVSASAAESALVALESARKSGVRVAFDVNYRAKLWHWSRELAKEELAARYLARCASQADLLFCGPEEAVRFLGVDASLFDNSSEGSESIYRALSTMMPNVRWIASSVRASPKDQISRYAGFLWDREEDRFFCSHPPRDGYAIGTLVDRLGIGDAFAAGLVFGLGTRPSDDAEHTLEAIRFATAAGCLAHSIEGDANQVSREEVLRLVQQGGAEGRVER